MTLIGDPLRSISSARFAQPSRVVTIAAQTNQTLGDFGETGFSF